MRRDRVGGMQKSQNNKGFDSGVSEWLRALNQNLLLTLESKKCSAVVQTHQADHKN